MVVHFRIMRIQKFIFFRSCQIKHFFLLSPQLIVHAYCDLMEEPLIKYPEGLYCPAGDFYIDPYGKVDRALVTHAHSDHARSGHKSYLVSKPCLPLLKLRLGQDVVAEGIDYGETRLIGVPAYHFILPVTFWDRLR